ncbi:MAG TPA: hypothetical protein VJ623_07915 [Holophagaceae bacterium]|nr:hypothetical protein [Holophagaceae bacterium]
MFELILRVTCLCVVLAGAETIQGIARVKLLVPRIGLKAAQRVSIVTGSILAFLICMVLVPSIGLHRVRSLLLLGVVISCFMSGFDIVLGRFVAKRPWSLVLVEFNPFKGGLLIFGVGFLIVAPLLSTLIHW